MKKVILTCSPLSFDQQIRPSSDSDTSMEELSDLDDDEDEELNEEGLSDKHHHHHRGRSYRKTTDSSRKGNHASKAQSIGR